MSGITLCMLDMTNVLNYLEFTREFLRICESPRADNIVEHFPFDGNKFLL